VLGQEGVWPPPKIIATLLTWRGWNPRVIRAGSRFHAGLLRRFRRTNLIGGDALVLTTIGRKTGRETSTPLFYAKDADRVLVAASFAGSGVPPGWYLNLVAHPDVRATIDGRTEEYRARTLTEAEAEKAWPKLLEVYPTFTRYRRRAKCTIPVVELRISSTHHEIRERQSVH
jgi:deazaflavin-dependent oxidoreductase (nitroreductase family)